MRTDKDRDIYGTHILDGNSEHVAHVLRKRGISEINPKFASVVHPNKCLKLIKLPISVYTCAPLSGLPFTISTMVPYVLILYDVN